METRDRKGREDYPAVGEEVTAVVLDAVDLQRLSWMPSICSGTFT
jgi:hypothetical protein